MLTGIQHTHSLLRWIVVILAIITLVRLMRIYFSNRNEFTPSENKTLRIFLIFFDIQILFGLFFFAWWITRGLPLEMYHWEHLGTMLSAAIIAHVSAVWKKKPAKARARNTIAVIIFALILILLGVWRLPQGWTLMPT